MKPELGNAKRINNDSMRQWGWGWLLASSEGISSSY
jgi:hypothetical protein